MHYLACLALANYSLNLDADSEVSMADEEGAAAVVDVVEPESKHCSK